MSRNAPRRPALLLLALMPMLVLTPAAAEPLRVGLDLSSPALAYRTFIDEGHRIEGLYMAYLAAPSFGRQIALGRASVRVGLDAFDMSNVPVATRPRAAVMAAAMMADILHRVPPPPPEALEAMRDLPARWTLPGTEIRLTRITEGPRAGEYVYSETTLARLPEFHAQIINERLLLPTPVPNWSEVQKHFVGALLAGLPVETFPNSLRVTVLGTPAWKALCALLAITLAALAMRGCGRVTAHLATTQRGWRLRALLLLRPLCLVVVTLLVYFAVISQTPPSGALAGSFDILAGAVLVIATAWVAWHLCWLVAEIAIASPRIPDDTYDTHLLRLVGRVSSVLAVGIILIYGANLLGLPALGLLAGVSVGGIALALAAQSTVENLLGGFTIFADRPFRVGDVIKLGALSGTVEGIGPRSSRIRAADGSLTSVPNADLAKAQLTNLSVRDRWIFTHRFPLPAGLSAAEVARLIETLREQIASHPALTGAPAPPHVALVPLEGTGLGIEVSAPLASSTREAFLVAQEALILEALETLEKAAPPRAVSP